MAGESPRRLAAAAAFLVLGSLPVLGAEAQPATEPGDLWEVTTKMSMEGMAMPAQTQKVCTPKVWKEPPGGMDERQKCTTSDFKLEGPKATWKITCADPEAMSGEGEIIRAGADAYSGTIRFKSSHGAMTLNLNGRRLEACNAGQK